MFYIKLLIRGKGSDCHTCRFLDKRNHHCRLFNAQIKFIRMKKLKTGLIQPGYYKRCAACKKAEENER